MTIVVEVDQTTVTKQTSFNHQATVISLCGQSKCKTHNGVVFEALNLNKLVLERSTVNTMPNIFPPLTPGVFNVHIEVDHFLALRCLRNASTSLLALCSTAE
jgi:hypothetical protein